MMEVCCQECPSLWQPEADKIAAIRALGTGLPCQPASRELLFNASCPLIGIQCPLSRCGQPVHLHVRLLSHFSESLPRWLQNISRQCPVQPLFTQNRISEYVKMKAEVFYQSTGASHTTQEQKCGVHSQAFAEEK